MCYQKLFSKFNFDYLYNFTSHQLSQIQSFLKNPFLDALSHLHLKSFPEKVEMLLYSYHLNKQTKETSGSLTVYF